MNEVIIFRHDLFKKSEPFIYEQARSLVNWTPIFVGRNRSSIPKMKEDFFMLWDEEKYKAKTKRVHQVITRDVNDYIDYLAGKNPKLIHAHFGVDAVYAEPIARKKNIPLVTTLHGFDVTTKDINFIKSMKPSWFNYLLYRRELALRGDMFICVSKYIYERALRLGFPSDRMIVHYMGVDVEKFFTPNLGGKRDGTLNILHVGRLVEKKGLSDLIRALDSVRKEVPKVKLNVVGDGPLLKKLTAQVADLKLERHIEFLGAVPHTQIIDLMKNASVICQPSVTASTGDTEGLPIVLMEASAMGLPIVSTYHAGIPELIKNGENGLLAKEHDVETLAESIVEILTNSNLATKLGRNARHNIELNFNVKKQSSILSEIYNNII